MDGAVERLLKDRGKGPRAGKKPISVEMRLAIVTRTAQEKPKHATHWSARMLAEEIGVGHTTVQRVWKEHGLKPHLSRPFKLSNDPKFAEKVVDIVGLYLNPPDKAAGAGEMLNIRDLKRAYEQAIGHDTGNSTVYDLLGRHGWRKLMPRPFHPQQDIGAQNAFKKTAFLVL
jgi:hypothetical protein